jgi:DNA-directed RNA polymerase subunit beta'
VRLTEWNKNKETGEFEPVTSLVETTVGRALLSEILPKGLPFSNMNKALKKKEISNASFRKCGLKATVLPTSCCKTVSVCPRTPVSRSPSTTCWCLRKGRHPGPRRVRSEGDRAAVRLGSGDPGERYNKVVDIWGKAGDDVSKVMMDQLKVQKTTDRHGNEVDQNRSTRFT